MGKKKKEVIFLGIVVMTLLAMLGIQQRQMKQYTEVLGRNVENTSNTTAAASGSAAGAKRQPVVYLTFDDGPSRLTEKYLDILKKHKIHATFFLIGQQVEEMPEIVERELKEGHEIGVHTYTHESCEIYASCQAYYEDVNKVRDVLEKRFDYKPQLWRFPWGSANCYIHSYKEEIIQRLGEQNMEYADWNVSAEDSVGSPTVGSILRNVKKDAFRVKDPVVLMHDSGSNQATLDSLEAVITLFEEQGFRFETMSQRENCCHFGQ